jgi:L-fucose isomerase-like protein
MTHFESQIGVAFRGKLKEGPITVFKCDGLMKEYFVSEGELLENLNEYNLCRTQIRLKLDESVLYFLRRSIGNHHLIVKGDHRELIDEFFKWL